jgi:hypothetical protein
VRLPEAERASVPREKVTMYLLSETHPTGRSKAAFFHRFGFEKRTWEVLAMALQRHARQHEVSTTERSRFGMRYTIEGELQTPDGRNPVVRTVWFIDEGERVPRLVTAYPRERRAEG